MLEAMKPTIGPATGAVIQHFKLTLTPADLTAKSSYTY